MKRASVLAALALTACGQSAPDGYTFEGAQWSRTSGDITFVLYPDRRSVAAAAPAVAHRDGEELMAWSIASPSRCTVHVVDPRRDWQPEWLGHEVAHCMFGEWHPKQNQRR